MANASVEKLKALGLRHGEKAVVGLSALLCLMFLFLASTRATIDLTPDQVKQAAQRAQSNIGSVQSPDDILQRLESEGLKNPGFEEIVLEQEKNLLVADNYKPRQLWVTPEPGAGLIRDQPELIAPTEIAAYPGRGGVLVWALDENGNRIPDPDAGKALDPETLARRDRKVRVALSGRAARARMGQAQREADAKKKREQDEKRRIAVLAGNVPKDVAAAADPAAPQSPMKEITKGVRWVAITGVLDYKRLKENYLTALKRPEVAYPNFKDLGVERQVRQTDGSWSDWQPIALEQNRTILDNLPEEDEEWTPETVRISALVAPLPFLRAGFWEQVHVARMVPKEKLQVAQAPPPGAEGFFDEGSMSIPEPPPDDSSMAMEMMGSGSGMEGEMMGMGGGGPTDVMNFEKSEVDELMVRALDFTVEPAATYRFRIRIVVFNPNRGREDVSPGVDTKSVELFGPWSEPTVEVSMPPDVATYAVNKALPVQKKLEQVNYEVARFSLEDGVTVVRQFPAAPGDLIGEVRTSEIPVSDGTGKKNRPIDFNSHQLVLDTMGGNQAIPPVGAGSGNLAVPAQSLVVNPDGSVVIRSQVNDLNDPVRKDMAENYTREIKESNQKRQSSMGYGYGGESGSGMMP